jgi:hypothetical protein
MTPKNECLSSVPNFPPVSSDADADVISRSFASIGRQQLGSYIAGLGVHGLGFVKELCLYTFFCQCTVTFRDKSGIRFMHANI